MNGFLLPVIEDNGGFFRRADALACGETDRSLQAAVREGQVTRIRHGAYAMTDDLAPLDELGRHLLLARAVVANQRGKVALTGPSAAALHGYTLYGHDLSVVHVIRLDGGPGRRETGVSHHVLGTTVVDDLVERAGLLTLDRARTVWEVARMSGLEGGVATIDSALHLDPRLVEELRACDARFAHHPGSRTARISMRLADPRAESAGESVTRVQCYRFGVPKPELQYRVIVDGRLVGIADFYWEMYRHLGEFDGKVKYERFLQPGESASDCVFREKRREDQMRSSYRGMSRFVWAGIMPSTARQTMLQLRRELEQSRRLYVRGRSAG